jgi:hypothetical protein
LIDIVQLANGIDHPQRYVLLQDFESRYLQILSKDGANYGWYQGQFLALVPAVYAKHGLDFFAKIRSAFPGKGYRFCSLGNEETLRRLDSIDRQSRVWAAQMRSKPHLR